MSAAAVRTHLGSEEKQVEEVARVCRSVVQPVAAPGAVNHGAYDLFSLVHVAMGLFFGALGMRFLPMLLLAVGWEVAEHVLKDCIPNVFVHPTQDTVITSTGDVLFALAGWALSRAATVAWRTRRPRTGTSGT
jgi:hypothetical protein